MKRILILIAVGLAALLVGRTPPADSAVKPQPVAEKTAEQKAQDTQWAKEVLLIRMLRDRMKNPASFELAKAIRLKGGRLCLTYRGTNSFNAVVMGRAVIDTKTTGASTEEYAWNNHCNGKTGTDISSIRWAI